MSNWQLVKYRACDGTCCVESPRFPVTGSRFGEDPNKTNIRGVECIYHLNIVEDPFGGCVLYQEESGKIPKDKILLLSPEELEFFRSTCFNWPLSFDAQNYDRIYTDAEREATGLDFNGIDCCHRWDKV